MPITNNKYMQRCLQLALKGIGNVAPNPLVGCVIVYDDKIIGEGYHQAFGKAHAEVNAINSVKNKSLLKNSTLYVNLEPCAHYGKTPPCADLINEHKIPRVVIGAVDSFSEVNGKGIEKLEKAGVEVVVNVLEKECRDLNKRFYTFHEQKRPYIILKWAQTSDRFLSRLPSDPLFKTNNWITNQYAKQFTHQQRAHESAILIGKNTVLADNPTLTVREVEGNNPLRIILSNDPSSLKDSIVINDDLPTIILNTKESVVKSNKQWIKLQTLSPSNVAHALYNLNVQSVIIEGGSMVLKSFISEGLWDEAYVWEAPIEFYQGIEAPEINGTPYSVSNFDNNQLSIFTHHHF